MASPAALMLQVAAARPAETARTASRHLSARHLATALAAPVHTRYARPHTLHLAASLSLWPCPPAARAAMTRTMPATRPAPTEPRPSPPCARRCCQVCSRGRRGRGARSSTGVQSKVVGDRSRATDAATDPPARRPRVFAARRGLHGPRTHALLIHGLRQGHRRRVVRAVERRGLV